MAEALWIGHPDPKLGQLHEVERAQPTAVLCRLPIQKHWLFTTESERVSGKLAVCSECRRVKEARK